MYMLVGETYIRDRDTGKDERLQLKFPLAKVRSEQTLTLQADGDQQHLIWLWKLLDQKMVL